MLTRPRRISRHSPSRLLIAVAILGSTAWLALPASPAVADASTVTVAGPPSESGARITVDKTTGLRNEVVTVSWTGFRPSVNFNTQTLPGFAENTTRFPVRVYQCRGADPAVAVPGDCYGSDIYEYPGRPEPIIASRNQALPDGPPNWAETATAPDGTGTLDVEVRTAVESSTLGCTEQVACSLVVVMNPGHPTERDPAEPQFPACATVRDGNGTTLCSGSGATWPGLISGNTIDAIWSWNNRVTIPIAFAPSLVTCPLGDADLRVIGSPKAQRAVASWQPATCQLADPLKIDYTAQGEPLARGAFLNGTAQVGLSNRGLDPQVSTDRTYEYAPVTTSGIAIAFRVDDKVTGRPIQSMKLTPRLVAKMVTASYGLTSFGPEVGSLGDPAVSGNPATIFQDPEFLALNDLGDGHAWTADFEAAPLIMADLSDMTFELTRWMEADPVTRAFLAGGEDEWGMRVNDNYKGIVYPGDSFELRDQFERMTRQFQPVQGLVTVAQKLASNSFTGTRNEKDYNGIYEKFGDGGLATVGRRSFIAIIDTASAAIYRFPVADIANAAGQFVGPTTDSMAAALAGMTLNPDGTRSADMASTDPNAYPLTMIDYAVAPTSGLDAAAASSVARFLDYAAGPGQVPGADAGQLPAGYLPLTAELAAETEAAADAVRAQDGAMPTPTPTPSPSPPSSPNSPSGNGNSNSNSNGSNNGGGFPTGGGIIPGGGSVPSGGSTPGVSTAPGDTAAPAVPPTPTTSAVAAGSSRPAATSTPAWIRYILPGVLIGGLAAALIGTVGSTSAGKGALALPAVLRRRRPPAGT